MYEIKQVLVTEYFEQARELADKHWQETESRFSDRPPQLDIPTYKAMESMGASVALGAFSDGLLIGYIAGFIVRHVHYDMTVAQHDVLFVAPEHRKGSVAIRLLSEFEKLAKDKGSECVLYHAKIGSQFASILDKRKYEKEEIIYRKGF